MMIPEFLKKMLIMNKLQWKDGNIDLHGVNPFIVPAYVFCHIYKDTVEKLGNEGREIFKNAGRYQTKKAFKRYKDVEKLEKSFEKFDKDPRTQTGLEFLRIVGFGEFDYIFYKSQKKAVVKVKNSVIAKNYFSEFGKSERPVCDFFVGLFEASAKLNMGWDCCCEEEKCFAQSGRGECIFNLKVK